MEFCWFAVIVLILSILGILFDIYTIGFSIVKFLINVIFTVLVVYITNWSCYSTKYSYIAWLMVIIHIVAMVLSIILINTDFGKELIIAEKQNIR